MPTDSVSEPVTQRAFRVSRTHLGLVIGLVCAIGVLGTQRTRARRLVVQPDLVTVPKVLRGEVKLDFVPEYERTMDRVLLAVERNGLPEDMAAKAGILSALPRYTEVLLLRDESMGGRSLHSRIGGATNVQPGLKIREANVRWFDPESATSWAQDLGEGLGGVMFLGAKGRQHETVLPGLGVRAVAHILPLDGGNVSLARNKAGERIVFIGEREFENARTAIIRQGFSASDARVLAMYCQTFGADKTVVLPTVGPDHIDQTVLFIGDGRAVTERVPELSAEDRRSLDEFLAAMARVPEGGELEYTDAFEADYAGGTRLADTDSFQRQPVTRLTNPRILMPAALVKEFVALRKRVPHLQDLLYTHEFDQLRLETERRLRENGFEVDHIPTSLGARLNKQYYVNSMIYRDRETGRLTILTPVYPEPGQTTRPSTESLTGTNAGVVRRLEALGFAVKPVPGQYLRGGSTHCSLYQL